MDLLLNAIYSAAYLKNIYSNVVMTSAPGMAEVVRHRHAAGLGRTGSDAEVLAWRRLWTRQGRSPHSVPAV